MATNTIATTRVFLDTACAIALSSPQDGFHARAALLADEIEKESVKLLTTEAVLLEVGNALSEPRHKRQAVLLLKALDADSNVEVVPFTTTLYGRAFELFHKHTDKAWGLTDCVSFVVMRERGLTEALTTDRHFEQAGFRVLLREL